MTSWYRYFERLLCANMGRVWSKAGILPASCGAQMLGWGETGNEETNSKVTPAEPGVMRKWNQVTAERRAGWKDSYLGESSEEGPVFDMTHAWCGGTSCDKNRRSTSPVAEWRRVHLPKRGTWVRCLGPEGPTCPWATEPVRCKYWTHAPQLLTCMPRACALWLEKSSQREASVLQRRVAPH